MGFDNRYFAIVVAAAILISLIIWLLKKNLWAAVLSGYIFFVVAVTLLIRSPEDTRYELVLFWSWKVVFKRWPLSEWRRNLLRQILLNIAMFIPIGFMIGRITGWKSILISFGFSLLIELTQLFTGRGLFEFDDLIHNTLGAAIGFGLLILTRKRQARISTQTKGNLK